MQIWEYIFGKRVLLDLLDDFEFLTKNGTILMDHAKFSHHIKILISLLILVTMAT